MVRFDDIVSSCVREESDGEPYLVVAPVEGIPEGYRVMDYVWEQTRGNKLTCSERLVL